MPVEGLPSIYYLATIKAGGRLKLWCRLEFSLVVVKETRIRGLQKGKLPVVITREKRRKVIDSSGPTASEASCQRIIR